MIMIVKPSKPIRPQRMPAELEQYIQSRPKPIREQIRAIRIRIEQLRAQTELLLAQRKE